MQDSLLFLGKALVQCNMTMMMQSVGLGCLYLDKPACWYELAIQDCEMGPEDITCCSVTLQTASRVPAEIEENTTHHTKVSQPQVYRRRKELCIFALVTLQGTALKLQKTSMFLFILINQLISNILSTCNTPLSLIVIYRIIE